MKVARALWDVLRLAVARERLGDADPATPPDAPPSPGVLHVLLVSREPLGTEPEPPPRRGGSLLRALFAIEDLPREPEPPRSPRRRRLAGLFALEKLDDSP